MHISRPIFPRADVTVLHGGALIPGCAQRPALASDHISPAPPAAALGGFPSKYRSQLRTVRNSRTKAWIDTHPHAIYIKTVVDDLQQEYERHVADNPKDFLMHAKAEPFAAHKDAAEYVATLSGTWPVERQALRLNFVQSLITALNDAGANHTALLHALYHRAYGLHPSLQDQIMRDAPIFIDRLLSRERSGVIDRLAESMFVAAFARLADADGGASFEHKFAELLNQMNERIGKLPPRDRVNAAALFRIDALSVAFNSPSRGVLPQAAREVSTASWLRGFSDLIGARIYTAEHGPLSRRHSHGSVLRAEPAPARSAAFSKRYVSLAQHLVARLQAPNILSKEIQMVLIGAAEICQYEGEIGVAASRVLINELQRLGMAANRSEIVYGA